MSGFFQTLKYEANGIQNISGIFYSNFAAKPFHFFSFHLLINCLDGTNGIANFCYFSPSFALFEGLSHTNAVLIATGTGVE